MKQRTLSFAAALAVACLAAGVARADERRSGTLDVEAAQALIAVQALDGWLMFQAAGKNPVAQELVSPGPTNHPWFYYVPAEGEPTALVHAGETASFSGVPGKAVPYQSTRQLRGALRKLLHGAHQVAMERAPGSKIPGLNRVDDATARLVKAAGVDIVSSAQLVQLTKALWGKDGRVAHYVAAHHLDKLAGEAMALIGRKLGAGEMITEYDVQQALLEGYRIRGLSGEAPVVAAGANTADPGYAPTARSSAVIKKGDLVRIELAARLADSPRPIYAAVARMGYVGAEVPAKYRDAFALVARARDRAIALIRERVAAHRPVRGFEVDEAARKVLVDAGRGEQIAHRTGHSLDTSLLGDGAHLDAGAARDTRNLVVGSGFTVGPGLYVSGEYGVRTEVDVFIGSSGLELTSPLQKQITAIPVAGK